MGTTISYNRPDGQSVAGYLAEPAQAAGAPGMVVIQEWWGLNDQIKGVADKLAAAGYRALVPDLYRGKVALAANEAQHLMTGLDFGDAAGQDVRGAVRHLKATGSAKVGVTGFCMGGALTRALGGERSGGGRRPSSGTAIRRSSMSTRRRSRRRCWATSPPRTRPSRSPRSTSWSRSCAPRSVKFEFHRYHAKHAFANETADSKNLPMLKYDPAAAALAWRRTMEFLAKHLR